MMEYLLDLKDIPYNAIKAGTKKVEGRVPTPGDKTPYDKLSTNDTIVFRRESDQELLEVAILFVHHYPDVREMLEAEGPENVLSSSKTIEESIERYNTFKNYKESIPKYGIYAIGVKPL